MFFLLYRASATNEHLEVETFNRITSLQDEMRRVHDTLEKLWEERDQRQNLLDVCFIPLNQFNQFNFVLVDDTREHRSPEKCKSGQRGNGRSFSEQS